MSTSLRRRMHQDLQLAGLRECTQKAYLRAVRQLAAHYRVAPDQLTESQVREYLLYLKNEKHFAAGALRIAAYGIKFFYTHTAPRDWQTLKKLRIPRSKTLPDVLSINEVRRLIAAVRKLRFKVYFWTVYSLGLRLQEGLNLQVGDIDSGRMLVHVRRGKGAKDRFVPLPTRTLALLRAYWVTHRHPLWLFPDTYRGHQQRVGPRGPMQRDGVQAAMRRLVRELGFRKKITVHTLRHSYATHLLEAGVSLRLIQQYLGHSSLQTTMIYLHLTPLGQEKARAAIESVMAE
jgi:integrase/recombinase XerD